MLFSDKAHIYIYIYIFLFVVVVFKDTRLVCWRHFLLIFGYYLFFMYFWMLNPFRPFAQLNFQWLTRERDKSKMATIEL